MVKKQPWVVLYVRIPRDLRDRIARVADGHGISMATVAKLAIAHGLDELKKMEEGP